MTSEGKTALNDDSLGVVSVGLRLEPDGESLRGPNFDLVGKRSPLVVGEQAKDYLKDEWLVRRRQVPDLNHG